MTAEAEVVLIVGIISAVSALAGALGATVVGWLLGRKTEARSEKRAAFVELLAAIDGCQHGALDLQVALRHSDKTEIQRQRDFMNSALKRVDMAASVAVLSLDEKHRDTIRASVTACINEYGLALKQEKFATVIPAAWNAIVALGRTELK